MRDLIETSSRAWTFAIMQVSTVQPHILVSKPGFRFSILPGHRCSVDFFSFVSLRRNRTVSRSVFRGFSESTRACLHVLFWYSRGDFSTLFVSSMHNHVPAHAKRTHGRRRCCLCCTHSWVATTRPRCRYVMKYCVYQRARVPVSVCGFRFSKVKNAPPPFPCCSLFLPHNMNRVSKRGLLV